MNFIDDTSWIDDPAVEITNISTGGNFALSVNGPFNATSLNQNGTDINNIFLKLSDFNPDNIENLEVANNIFTSNLIFSNSINQIHNGNINLKGNILTSGNINIGTSTDTNKSLFIGGSIEVNSNIKVDNNIITTNIFSSNISNLNNITNIGNIGIGTDANNIYKLNVDGISSFSNFANFSNSINQVNSLTPNFFLGNLGIGTSTNLNSNLTVNGTSLIRGIASFSSSIIQTEPLFPSYFRGRVGIGTTIPTSNLTVQGTTIIFGISSFSNSIIQLNSLTPNYFMGNVGIGTTNPTSSLTIQGNSLISGIASFSNSIFQSNANTPNYFMGRIGIGTLTNLNSNLTVNGSSFITGIASFSNSIIQSNATTPNYFMGNVGIGTSTNLNSNLTVQGRTLFNNIASFSSSIIQSNISTPNIFMGNVGIGTSTNLNSNLTVQGQTLFNDIASFSNSINQVNELTSNFILGNLGIGTSTNLNSNLTIQGSSFITGIASFSNAIIQSNALTPNYFMGNVGIGTTVPSQNLDVIGNIKTSNIICDASLLNNIKLENQSFYTFPPPGITGIISTINYSIYGNGTYIISASSFINDKEPYLCFNDILTNEWTPSTSPYTGTSFSYIGSFSNVVSDTIYSGEWIQLQYLRGFSATSITITGIPESNIKCPNEFVLAGSIDEKNWVLLSLQSGITNYNITSSKNFSINNNTSYYYYRIIITKTIGSTSLSIANISFNGTQNTNFTNLDNYNKIIYNTNIKQYLFNNSSSSPEVIAYNEIFNCVPLNPYKQTLTLNSQTFIVYSSSTYDGFNYTKHLLFNNSTSDSFAAHWLSNNYISTGEISTNNNNYIKPDYKGDWIIVKLPFKIILTSFIFYQRTAAPYRAPARWKCYGSNDGINFTEIVEGSYTTTDAVYTSSAFTDTLSSSFNVPYSYIGWTINKLIGNNLDAHVLNFTELRIYGKDDISNAYLNTWIKNQNFLYNNSGNVGINSTTPEQRLDVSGNIKADFLISDGSLLNNLNLDENQTIYAFPPSGLNNTSTTWMVSLYGNGSYTASASSSAGTGKEPWHAFNRTLTDDWTPSTTPYTGALFSYVGSISTVVSGIKYSGEWVQIRYLRGFSATSMTITGITSSNAKCPNEFILTGSIDEKNWVLLSLQTGITDYTNIPSKTFNIYNNTLYYFYRLIVTKTIGDNGLSIADILLNGTQNTKFTNLDNYNKIIYNTNEKQFPPNRYSSVTNEEISSNELSNCIPLNSFKQILTVNELLYTIYSSSTAGTGINNKEYLFDYFGADSKWQTAQYTNGSYSANTNYIKDSTYKGDWVIIKFPYKIILTKFIIYQKTVDNSPKTWRCYGSNDGINFTEIYEANEISITGAIYTNNNTQKNLPSLFNIPFLYIGWTFGTLIGSTASQLEILEIQIFGKDDISNSYLNSWVKNGLNIYNTIGNIGIGTSTNINYKLSLNGDINASSISSNGYNIDLLYSKNNNVSNLLYNSSYTPETKYPPKLYNSVSRFTNISNELFNINPLNTFKEIITVQPESGYSYGIGNYIIYSSSLTSTNHKSFLFDNSNSSISQWDFNYNPNNGYYIESRTSYIKSDYKGDWIIIKLPTSIILTKFIFKLASNIERSPSLWRCYGSNDGINFTIIPEASNEFIPLIESDYISNIYTKIITLSLNISYNYIGFTFNKLIGNNSNSTSLMLSELELFGKEVLSIVPIYTTSNQVMSNPNILKKFGFICSISTAVTINSSNYFKFDIDLTKYTSTQNLDGTNEPYRIFKLTIFKNSAYFSAINNDIPDILSYEIYMSNKLSNGTLSNEISGVNICAIGYPINLKLDKIMPTSIFLMNSPNFNNISIISTSSINVRCIITDLLN